MRKVTNSFTVEQWVTVLRLCATSQLCVLLLFAKRATLSVSTFMVHSIPTGQVVPTSGELVDSTCDCSGVSATS